MQEFKLNEISLFASLQEEEAELMKKQLITRSFPKNSVVLNEGDNTDALYIIEEGRCKISKIHVDGKEIVLAVLEKGDYFGEMALIDELPRSASVITKEASKFTIFLKEDFQRILLNNPAISLNVMKGLSERLRASLRQIEGLAFMDVYGRIARLLLELSYEEPEKAVRVVPEPLTHKEIANRIGASREVVSRILKDLITGGYISSEQKIITIRNKLPHAW